MSVDVFIGVIQIILVATTPLVFAAIGELVTEKTGVLNLGVEGMMLCEMPIDKHRAMKAYYNNKSVEQNESLAGDLDSLGQKTGQPIYQERKSSVSGGRQVSVMED